MHSICQRSLRLAFCFCIPEHQDYQSDVHHGPIKSLPYDSVLSAVHPSVDHRPLRRTIGKREAPRRSRANLKLDSDYVRVTRLLIVIQACLPSAYTLVVQTIWIPMRILQKTNTKTKWILDHKSICSWYKLDLLYITSSLRVASPGNTSPAAAIHLRCVRLAVSDKFFCVLTNSKSCKFYREVTLWPRELALPDFFLFGYNMFII